MSLIQGADSGNIARPVLVDSLGRALVSLAVDSVGLATDAKLEAVRALLDLLENALATVATDKLRTSVIDSALPSGAATLGEQQTQTTALQLIDDLRNALATVATDKLRASVVDALPAGANNIGDVDVLTMPTVTIQAAGGDKPFALEGVVKEERVNTNLSAGANGLNGTAVPAGKLYVITQVTGMYLGTPPSFLRLLINIGGINLLIHEERSITSGRWYSVSVNLYLSAGDYVAAYVEGATAGDDLTLQYCGYAMDAP